MLVAARNLEPGHPIERGDLRVREVPERFAPPDALARAEEANGAEPRSGLARGAYVTASALALGTSEAPGGLRRGERAVEVAVAGGDGAAPGGRADVLVSTGGRSFLALEDVEVLDLSEGVGGQAADGEGAAAAATAIATLRVTLRQAVYLTAAQNFAREVRLLPRPPGDRSRAGRAAVSAGGL